MKTKLVTMLRWVALLGPLFRYPLNKTLHGIQINVKPKPPNLILFRNGTRSNLLTAGVGDLFDLHHFHMENMVR